MKLGVFKFIPFIYIFSLIFISCSKSDVSDMVLNEDFQYLGINDTIHLTSILKAPEDKDYTVKWTSQNENIAVVSANGVVKALSEGSTVIVAEAGKESVSCEIHVVTYKLNGAYAKQDTNSDLPKYYVSLLKSNSIEPGSDITLHFEMFTSQNASSNLFVGNYQAIDSLNIENFTFLKGQADEESGIQGSFIEDRYLFNSTYLISGGAVNIAGTKEQYLIKGSVSVNDLSGDSKQISFIYIGNILIKSTFATIL